MEDTRTKTSEEIEAEKNSTASSEDLNPASVALKAPKKQKTSSKFTTSNVNVEVAGQAYLAGLITRDEWSRTTPALRKAIERYAKKHKAEFLANLKLKKEEVKADEANKEIRDKIENNEVIEAEVVE